MTKRIGAALQVAGMAAVAVALGLWTATLWAGILTAGLFAVAVGVLLELETVRPSAPAAGQPSVGSLKRALQRRFSRTYRDPRTGGRLTTAPPPEREAGGAGDPTADQIDALDRNFVARGPSR